MKKVIAIFFILICLFSVYSVHATSTTQIMDNKTSSQLVEIKDKELKEIKDYTEAYGSESYGFTAYMLNICNCSGIATYICNSCKKLEGLTNESSVCCK